MLEQIEKIIIVVGCQRSGTTLLGHIMGAPKHALLLDETDVVTIQKNGGYQNWIPKALNDSKFAYETLQDVLAKARLKYKRPDDRILDQGQQLVLAPTITQLVLKAPNLTYHFEDIAMFNKAVGVIYALRDPRSVVASMLKLDHINFVENQLSFIKEHPKIARRYEDDLLIMADPTKPRFIRNASLWKVKSSLYRDFEKQNFPSTLCRYENLVRNSEIECQKIAERLSISFDELMLHHHIEYEGVAQGRTDRTRSVDQNSERKWIDVIGQRELHEMHQAIGEAAENMGYFLNSK